MAVSTYVYGMVHFKAIGKDATLPAASKRKPTCRFSINRWPHLQLNQLIHAPALARSPLPVSPNSTQVMYRTVTPRFLAPKTLCFLTTPSCLVLGARVDPATASKKIVESLERAGWARHHVSRPGLGYWVCNPGGIWLTTLAAFGGPCPPFLSPLARKGERVASALGPAPTVSLCYPGMHVCCVYARVLFPR